jgi:hypothetical protein
LHVLRKEGKRPLPCVCCGVGVVRLAGVIEERVARAWVDLDVARNAEGSKALTCPVAGL